MNLLLMCATIDLHDGRVLSPPSRNHGLLILRSMWPYFLTSLIFATFNMTGFSPSRGPS